MIDTIKDRIRNSAELKNTLLSNGPLLEAVYGIIEAAVQCYQNDGKVLWCGNGGSAADAQHLAAELSGRFYTDRPPLFSEALHTNSSYLTAVANDYGYDKVFSRMVEAAGREGDLLIGMSTSGNSINVVQALETAKKRGMVTAGFTGMSGGKMAPHCRFLVSIPSKDTPRIQECHMLLGHTICELIESTLFSKGA
jgi:D-sedoheptulose 7-phosphate isomerase